MFWSKRPPTFLSVLFILVVGITGIIYPFRSTNRTPPQVTYVQRQVSTALAQFVRGLHFTTTPQTIDIPKTSHSPVANPPLVLPANATSYTRGQWATDVLKAIGNTNPDPNTVNWVVGWTDWESGGSNVAAYNLLNTTQQMPGSWSFNSVGVQNFTSYQEGVAANALVLENGYYPALLQALRTNDLATLANPGSDIQSELSTWGTGWRSWGFSGNNANESF
jgi:hypothetical protein